MNRPPEPLDPRPELDDAGRHSAISDAIARLDAAARSAPGGRHTQAHLTGAAQEISALAHERGLQVEQVLIAVKDAWRALPAHAGRRQASADAVLDQLITLCIREYYGPRAD